MVILIADGEASSRKTLHLLLRAEHEVILCQDGSQALLHLAKSPVDVVFIGNRLTHWMKDQVERIAAHRPSITFAPPFETPIKVPNLKLFLEGMRTRSKAVTPPPADIPTLDFATIGTLSELRDLLLISRTNKALLDQAEVTLESLPDATVTRMIELGLRVLKHHFELPRVENNYHHVEEQLLYPIREDSEDLADAFGINPLRLELLVVLHDLGKVEIPAKLFQVLNEIFPKDYVAREVLTHEYASMQWVDAMGKHLNLSREIIRALQILIANHNFGPDLCDPKHQHLLQNWWPSNFRMKVIPALRSAGLNLDELYSKTPDGEYQYNHTEDSRYASLLSAYDRAIATKFNVFGVATWQKFAEQNYLAWQAAVNANQSVESPLKSTTLTEKMEVAARWALTEIEAIWSILEKKHLLSKKRESFRLEQYRPYLAQKEGVEKLLRSIENVKKSNIREASGRLLYHTQDGETFRVDHASKLYYWVSKTNSWTCVAEDQSPINLFFEIVRSDI